MPPNNTATQEGVVIVRQEGVAKYMAVKLNGTVEYYKLRLMSWQDHVEMHGAQLPNN